MFFFEDYFLSLKVLCTSNIFDVNINLNSTLNEFNGFGKLKKILIVLYIRIILNWSLFHESLMTSSLTINFKLQENISFHSYNDMVIRIIIMTTENKYIFFKKQFAKISFDFRSFLITFLI